MSHLLAELLKSISKVNIATITLSFIYAQCVLEHVEHVTTMMGPTGVCEYGHVCLHLREIIYM